MDGGVRKESEGSRTNNIVTNSGGEKVPYNIALTRGKNNPFREIDLSWSEPKQQPTEYSVAIYRKDERKLYEQQKTNETNFTFKDLAMDTSYYCTVQAIYEDGPGEICKSDEAKTETRTRDETYDILKRGKCMIVEPGLKYFNSHVECHVAWATTDSEEVKNNFELINQSVTYRSTRSNVENRIDDLTSEACMIKLDWASRYRITVRQKYMDLDSCETCVVKTDKHVETDIGKPTNIHAVCLDQEVSVTWKAAPGAESYEVLVEDVTSSENYLRFPYITRTIHIFQMDEKCRCGKRYKFSVVAISHDKSKKSTSSSEIVLGGESAPINVVATESAQNKCREVVVKWEEPKIFTPIKYDIQILDTKNEIISKSEVEATTFTFSDLPSGQTFYATVRAVYSNDVRSEQSRSNHHKTHPNNRDKYYDISKKGKPSLKEMEIKSDENEVEYEFRWKKADIEDEKENYKMVSEMLTIKDSLNQAPKEHFLDGEKCFVNKKLKRGLKYQVQVYNVYLDLDSRKKITTTSEVIPVSVGIEKPSNIEVNSADKKINMVWTKVIGASKYTVTVKNEDGNICHSSQLLDAPKYSFNLNKDCRNGKSYTFTVEAHGFHELIKSKRSTEVLLGGSSVPRSVKADSTTYRCIRLKWDKPGDPNIVQYECSLYSEGNIICEPKILMEEECVFSHLKTDTTYYGQVVAIYSEGKRSAISMSNTCKTSKRVAAVNNAINGKAKNVTFATFFSPSEVKYDIKWDVENINEILKDFAPLDPAISIIDKSSEVSETIEPKVTGKNEASVALLRGSEYLIIIKNRFQDLDNGEEMESEYKVKATPDVEAPTIVDISYELTEMVLSWKRVEGAKSYRIMINDTKGETLYCSIDLPSSKTNYKMPLNRYCGYGKSCTIIVAAVPLSAKPKHSEAKDLIIGGDKVPYNITAEVVPEHPHRQVQVKWKPPRNQSSSYEVKLLDTNGKQVGLVTTKDTTVVFNQLKSNTTFIANVISVFKDGSNLECFSNSVKTRVRDRQDVVTKQSKFGAARNISHKHIPHTEQVCVTWEDGEVTEDYKILKYKIAVKKHKQGLLWDTTETVLQDTISFENEKSVFLKGLQAGIRYEAKLETTFIDIDSEKEDKSKNIYHFYANLKQPRLNLSIVDKQNIKFTWFVEGAEAYKVDIKEKNSGKSAFSNPKVSDAFKDLKLNKDIFVGRAYRIKVIATGPNDITSSAEEDYLIGEEFAATYVNLDKGQNPRREVKVSWKASKNYPKHYEVHLYEGEKKIRSNETSLLQTDFKELKSDCTYVCKITAVQEDEKNIYTSISNELQTNKRVQTDKEKQQKFGFPEKLDFSLIKEGQALGAKLSWTKVEMGENYKVHGHHIAVTEKGSKKKIYESDVRTEREALIQGLEHGCTYTVSFYTIHVDLDTHKEAKKCEQYTLHTDPNSSNVHGCKWGNGTITFSWQAVHGAQEYRLLVKDELLRETLLLLPLSV